jgi:uncharacterized iron-regulated membrane protein
VSRYEALQGGRRGALLRLHRWLGLVLLLPLLAVAVSGTGLAFARELDRVLAPELWTVPAAPTLARSADRVTLDRLIGQFAAHWPQHRLVRIAPPATARDAAMAVAIPPAGTAVQLFLDPIRNRALGQRAQSHDPVRRLGALHRGLVLSEPGRLVVLIASAGLLVLAGSSLLLGRGRPATASTSRLWHRRLGRWGGGFWVVMAVTGLLGVQTPRDHGGGVPAGDAPAPDFDCGNGRAEAVWFGPPVRLVCLPPGAIGPMQRYYRWEADHGRPATRADWSLALHTGALLGTGGRMVWMWLGLALGVTLGFGAWLARPRRGETPSNGDREIKERR